LHSQVISRRIPGNDTIDRYPLPYEGKLRKILCIRKELFEKLCLETQEFLATKTAPKKTKVIAAEPKPLCDVPQENTLRHTGYVYTPTKIWATRYSELWQWQRVSEWWREYGTDEYLNEKRHILV
jgi:hypothetical protein